MQNKIIGLSAGIFEEKDYDFAGYKKCYVNEDYVDSVIKAGGIPFILPVVDNKKVIENYISRIDGLILTGGNDVNPLLYNEEPKVKLESIYEKRDYFEFLLLEYALKKEIPILGICRGLQLINVFFGGSLYQDLSYDKNSYVKHNQKNNPTQKTHTVKLKNNSKIYNVFKKEIITVNSFHHQIINKLAEEFEVTAQAKDGVIECIESKHHDFLMAIQWHPEMLHNEDFANEKIFVEFLNAI
ncbi:MAG: gamma-glutamyl-gamma-aminobutyrate hydrolase family protein [Peptoniphilaceae bacterium]|nr:gamma-glutamyl-gamma-aminobutyrate hydrolase family protein [Peptoniphilaceae bacterium]MDY3738567.1 gamma-glutamyl-gamma-aminobutyrate hydrolase family protein [Peptoniphilaceae bacterium]